MSDKAAACPHCGAPVLMPMAQASVPAPQPPPEPARSFKWWLWGPIAAVVLFLGYGASIPKNQADANAFARTCRDMFAQGAVASMQECNETEAKIRNAAQTAVAPTKPVEWPAPPAVLSGNK